MPSYKTHSIHGEIILPQIEKKIDIDKELIKIYCIGPDSLIATDYNTFNHQHNSKTKDYFEVMLKLIKKNKLQENEVVMSFLYGQLDHFILDCIMHPFIYYFTEDLPKNHIINPHSLVEMSIDNYIMQKYHKNDILYYKNIPSNYELNNLINALYQRVYSVYNTSINYNIGISLIKLFDILVRRLLKFSWIINVLDIQNITYNENIEDILPYLNLENEVWYHPETGEEFFSSFNDLWNKAVEIVLEVINDANRYLYQNKSITNYYLLNNISYDTSIPCEKGKKLKYLKKYY